MSFVFVYLRLCTSGMFSFKFHLSILPVPVFGIDLTSQYDVHMQPAPTVVLKCIEAVESRGIYIHMILRTHAASNVLRQ